MNLVSYSIIQDLGELKEALDITGTAYDAVLKGNLNRATDLIERYCGRRFFITTYGSEEYSGDGTYILNFRNYPVTELLVAQVATGDFDNRNWEDLETSQFKLMSDGGKDRGQLYYSIGFCKGVNNYRFNYIAGYTAANMPNDLKQACIDIASYLFNRRKATPGMKSETLGKYSYTMADIGQGGIIKALGLSEILDFYRNITV